jgi:hypothetical protein
VHPARVARRLSCSAALSTFIEAFMNAAADTIKDVRANVLNESAIDDLLLYNNVNRHVCMCLV